MEEEVGHAAPLYRLESWRRAQGAADRRVRSKPLGFTD